MGTTNITRAILAGFVATLMMTILMYAVPLMGMPEMDIAAMLGSMMAKQMPQPMTPYWWMGMLVHFVNGTILFSLIYAFLIYGLLPGRPWLRGLIWGVVLWLIAQIAVMPVMGMGRFSANSPKPLLAVMASLIAHMIYGSLLGAIAGPQAVHGRKYLKSKKVAVLVADGFEQTELLEPRTALQLAGAITQVVSPATGKVKGWNGSDWGKEFQVDVTLESASSNNYEALLLPGGVMSVDKLRSNPKAVQFIKDFFQSGKPVAAISHGPVTLIDAGMASGRKLTSFESVRADLKNAGAEWLDEAVVVDSGLVTGRKVENLSDFNRKMIAEFAKERVEVQPVATEPVIKQESKQTEENWKGTEIPDHGPVSKEEVLKTEELEQEEKAVH